MAKKCSVGKSCGSACINKGKVCKLDLAGMARGILADLRRELKEERKDLYRAAISQVGGFDDRTLRTTLGAMESVPEPRGQAIEMSILALKVAIRKSREERKADIRKKQEVIEKGISSSPKHSEIPGNHSPIKLNPKTERKELEEIVRRAEKSGKDWEARMASMALDALVKRQELQKDLKEEQKKLSDIERRIKDGDPKWTKGQLEFEAAGVKQTINRLRMDSTPLSPSLSRIYDKQGFNARPEVVPSRAELEARRDILVGDDGKPVIAYRGVTTREYADQFRYGEEHFPGRGIFGNGSYSVAQRSESKGLAARKGGHEHSEAIREANAYGSPDDPQTVVAFGIKKGARIYEVPSADETTDRMRLMEEARQKTGYIFQDSGEAAAALGYDAMVRNTGEGRDYYIIFNRGALVVASEGVKLGDFDPFA
jgi:hypothetical protein